MTPNKDKDDEACGKVASGDRAEYGGDAGNANVDLTLCFLRPGTDGDVGTGIEAIGRRRDLGETTPEQPLLTPVVVENILGPDQDTQCGFGAFRGGALQRLASPVTYLVISSVVALVQGMFYTYANATLSTVEKRFGLPSKISGLVTTGNDLVQLVLAVHITFLAGQGHRPRWLALGMLAAALGCLLAVMPHFLFGAGDLVSLEQESGSLPLPTIKVCGGSDNSSLSCDSNTAAIGLEQYTVVTLQLLSQMLAGFASLLYYTIGYSYLDEAVSKKKVPFFLAVSGSLRILGPVCGYSLAAWSLSHWVSPSHAPHLNPQHPRWVGAWWIGYLVIGSSLLVITWSLVLMPRTLPGARQRVLADLYAAAEKGREAMDAFTKTLRPAKSRGCKGMCGSMWRVLSNKVFILITINQLFFWFAFFGYITFKPKFLEHQFKMSAAQANQYIAGAALAATLVGWLATGATLSLFRPCAKFVLTFMATLSLINCILHLCMVNISCDHDVIHGMDLALEARGHAQTQLQTLASMTDVGSRTKSLSECASGCGCSLKFSPVCVNGNNNFYSACFAGCTSAAKVNRSIFYENCTCSSLLDSMNNRSYITPPAVKLVSPDVTTIESGTPLMASAEDGYCRHDCPTFYMYLALTVLTKMTLAASRVPVNIILFRCVEERDKDLGLGVFNAALALAASIPAPIVFGWAIDHSCRLWEQKCGRQGFCWLYDLDAYRHILHGIPAGLMACCLLTELILLSLHKSIHLYGEEEKKTPSTQLIDRNSSEEENKFDIDAC